MTEIKRPEPFKILRTWAGKSMGTTHEHHELVECPDCGHEFVRDVSTGCFHHRVNPMACPKCNYPWTFYHNLTMKKEEEKPFNPSRRLTADV